MSTRFGNGMTPAAPRFNPRMTQFASQMQRPIIDRPAQHPEEMAALVQPFLTPNDGIHVGDGDVFIRRDSAGETQLVGKAFDLLKPSPEAFNVHFETKPKVLEVKSDNGPVEEKTVPVFPHQRPNHFLYPLSEGKVEITPKPSEASAQPFKKITYEKMGRHHKLSVDYTDAAGRPHQRVLEHTAEIRRDVGAQSGEVNPFMDGEAIQQVRDQKDPTGFLHKLNERLALTYFLKQPEHVPEEAITLPSVDASTH